MEREAKAELSGVDDPAEKVKKMGDLIENNHSLAKAEKIGMAAATKSRAARQM
ncbi:hypothetical protein PVK06_005567 [Gossypium arboreum]|uniref:Uncharacterized protein n=1 Tax=Gossypium arboreum TaxID=29729 RepID=A0ABR0QW70_GOSAR|nr:hypothetical protein PVK06_005567 [Gossypium arboreum]